MPADDVSDLRDVFDAINRLCETMRTSTYEDAETIEEEEEELPVEDNVEEVIEAIETVEAIEIAQVVEVECEPELASPTEVEVRIVDAYRAERWSDALVSPPDESDTEHALVTAEPVSEMYYTASSEVSLTSDGDVPEKVPVEEDAASPRQDSEDKEDKESRKECVMAGHVAAMRERFESMTRTNTPCPELARSSSPSLDLFRNITPSPDHMLG